MALGGVGAVELDDLLQREPLPRRAQPGVPPQRRPVGQVQQRVPLCARAVEVLREAERLRGVSHPAADEELVFRSFRGKAIDAAVISKLVSDLGIAAVPHGFRSSFRDWASERTNHPREVIAVALAHAVKDQTEAAYARSDLFERRRQQLMDDLGTYLTGERGRAVSLRR